MDKVAILTKNSTTATVDFTFEETLQFIKECIINTVDVKYIYLFGSCAWGTPTIESDIDIYVVLYNKYKNLNKIYVNIFTKLLEKKIYFVDLHLVPESIFNNRKNVYLFEKKIVNNGKLIYE